MWNHKGYTFAMDGNFDDALKCFNKVLDMDEKNHIALSNKGYALLNLRRPREAYDFVKEILTYYPRDIDALIIESIALRDLGRPVEGLRMIDEVLKEHPNNFNVLAIKAMLLNESDRPQEVLEICNEILVNYPNHLQTLVNKAAALSSLKQFDESMKIYDKILKENPNYVVALVNKGILHSKMGEIDKAIELYDKALMLEPNNPFILGNKGNDLDLKGKTDEALLYYDKALEIDSENEFVLVNKAAVLNNVEKYSESLELLEKLKSLHPDYPHTLTHLGIVNLNLANFKIALDNFLKAKELLPSFYTERIKLIDDKIKLSKTLIDLEKELDLVDRKFLELIRSERWLELKDFSTIFYDNFKLIIDKYKTVEFPTKFTELLSAKKECINLVNKIFKNIIIPNNELENFREIFRRYKIDEYILVVNNIENLSINLKNYGSLEEFLLEKEDIILKQLHDLELLDGSLTREIFKNLKLPASNIKNLLKTPLSTESILREEQKEVNVMQISDLHFDIENLKEISEAEIIKRDTTLSNFRKNIRSFLQSHPNWKPDIIVINGDIGYAGKEEDYRLAKKWIEGLLSDLKMTSECLMICPGNHDRDISNIEIVYPKDIEESDQNWYQFRKESNKERFKNFITFSNEFLHPLSLDGKDQYLAGSRIIDGIRFLVLNSARYAYGGRDEKGKLFLGWPDVCLMEKEDLLVNPDKFDSSIITVLLFHHPREWFHNQVINEYRAHAATYNFLAERCHIILTGHVHAEKIGKPQRTEGGAINLSIGAMYLSQNYINNCAILKINLDSRKVSRLIIEYDSSELEWKPKCNKVDSYDLHKNQRVTEYSRIKNVKDKDLENKPQQKILEVSLHPYARIELKNRLLPDTYIIVTAVNKSVRPITVRSCGFYLVEEDIYIFRPGKDSSYVYGESPRAFPIKLEDGDGCHGQFPRTYLEDKMREYGITYPIKIQAFFDTYDGKFFSEIRLLE